MHIGPDRQYKLWQCSTGHIMRGIDSDTQCWCHEGTIALAPLWMNTLFILLGFEGVAEYRHGRWYLKEEHVLKNP